MENPISSAQNTRRQFLTASSAAAGGAALLGAFPHIGNAQEAKGLRIGLVGCGGRGTGAANDALMADRYNSLVAIGDLFPEQIEKSLANITKSKGDQVQVPEKQRFVGLDAIDKVLACDLDIVLLTTPPGFRPEHLRRAIAAGKHVFCEKPVAVDAPGVRSVLETAKLAKQKNLGIQSGFCWRANFAERATFEKLHSGFAGEVRSYYGTYLTQTPWVKARQPGWTDLEWQIKNWMYFTWLSGDFLTEQAVHTVDKMSWAFKDEKPKSALALGGRQQRVESEFGHIYDHFAVTYDYEGGRRGFVFCRQQQGCDNDNSDQIICADATCSINGFRPLHRISGKVTWDYERSGGKKNQMYVTEHEEFVASIRSGTPLNMGEQLAHSTLLAIMGRMSAYTGRTIAYDDALASEEKLGPQGPLDWNMKLDVPPVAMPGRTKFI
jgi:predicted dehydrogenase